MGEISDRFHAAVEAADLEFANSDDPGAAFKRMLDVIIATGNGLLDLDARLDALEQRGQAGPTDTA
jgi:hypothetical protein